MKSRTWHFDPFVLFLIYNSQWVSVVKPVGCSDEPSLFANELIVVCCFAFRLCPAESGHSDVISVHGPRHGVDESWLTLVDEAIDLVGIDFNFLPAVNHFLVLFTWYNLLDALLPVLPLILIHSSKIYPLLVLECLDFKPVSDTFAQ